MDYSHNKARYKNAGNGSDEMRKRRVEQYCESNKRNRNYQQSKQRNLMDDVTEPSLIDEIVNDIEMISIDVNNNVQPTEKNPEWMNLLYNNNSFKQRSALHKIQSIMFKKSKETIQQVKCVLPRLIELFQDQQHAWLQHKIGMILVELSAETISDVLPSKTISSLVNVFKLSQNEEIKGQVLMILSNIAAETNELRCEVLESEAFPILLSVFDQQRSLSLLRRASFMMTNLCHKLIDKERNAKCVMILKHLVTHFDSCIVVDALRSLRSLCNQKPSQVQTVIDAGICPDLVYLLHNQSTKVVLDALATINILIISSSEEQLPKIIDSDTLMALWQLLSVGYHKTKTMTCLIISNIAYENTQQIQAIIDFKIFPLLIDSLQTADDATQVEAAWAIRQCISKHRTSPEQFKYFMGMQCIPVMCHKLDTINIEILCLLLRSLRNILVLGGQIARQEVLKYSGNFLDIDTYKRFLSHEDKEVRHFANHILKNLIK